jgi:membrane protease YdiL (CAAX protease family)
MDERSTVGSDPSATTFNSENRPLLIDKSDGTGFRSVPWRWSDIGIGLAPVPIVAMMSFADWDWMARSYVVSAAIVVAGIGWMIGYPLWVARRRRPGRVFVWPGQVAVLREGLWTLPLLLLMWAINYGVVLLAIRVGLEAPQTEQVGEAFTRATGAYQLVLFFIGVVISPIAEEVFFRGFLFNAFRRKMSGVLAAILQAGLFAIGHTYSLSYVIATFVIGLFLAWVYAFRRTLLAPVFLHICQNFAAMLVTIAMANAAARVPVIGIHGDASPEGFIVRAVTPDGPAASAGLQPGDVVTVLDGYGVRSLKDVKNVLRLRTVGDTVRATYLRDGESANVEMTTTKRPD